MTKKRQDARPIVPEHIALLNPYVPGKPLSELERELGITGAIKLASNENPLGPSPKARDAMVQVAEYAHFYPDGAAFEFKRSVAKYTQVDVTEVVTGNGSNELLTLIARTFCVPGDHAVISDYSFIAYRVIMQAANLTWTSVATRRDYATDVDAMIAAVRDDTRLLFVANPNNPTGTHLKAREVRRILEEVPEHVIVVFDEAYHEYVQDPEYASALSMRSVRELLVVTRTFSKVFGLGGARAGFAIAPAFMADYMTRVREPFNVNALAQAAAIAALDDEDFVCRSVEANESGRLVLAEGLLALSDLGVIFTPSQTNFLLIETPYSGRDVYDVMLRQGVIVRPMGGYGLPRALRITIGTREQCERCLRALRQAVLAQQ